MARESQESSSDYVLKEKYAKAEIDVGNSRQKSVILLT